MTRQAGAHPTEAALIGRLNEIATGNLVARCVEIIADLGIADLITDMPEEPAELARKADVDCDALARVLRLLSGYGIFAEHAAGFSHSPLSRYLRSDHPQSQRAWIRLHGSEATARVVRNLDHCVRSGLPAVSLLDPPGLFAYLASHPQEATLFNAAMAAKSQGDIAAILRAYDFSGFSTVGDIGGGHGHLLRAVLQAARDAHGTLFDLPAVIEEARRAPAPRLGFVAGDFFSTPLPACQCYVLMNVLHDWDDKRAARILTALSRTAPPAARLLVCEMVLPEQSAPPYALTMDVAMLAFTGGRERKGSQYAALLEAGGWQLRRMIPTGANLTLLEATAAGTV